METCTLDQVSLSHFEQAIQSAFTLSPAERIYRLEYIQQEIYNTLPHIHDLDITNRLIILFNFVGSAATRIKTY